MDLSHYTKKELVDMINKLDGPEVTTRPRKATLIEILLERIPVEPVDIDSIPETDFGFEFDADYVMPTTVTGLPEERITKDPSAWWIPVAWVGCITAMALIVYILATI